VFLGSQLQHRVLWSEAKKYDAHRVQLNRKSSLRVQRSCEQRTTYFLRQHMCWPRSSSRWSGWVVHEKRPSLRKIVCVFFKTVIQWVVVTLMYYVRCKAESLW